MIYNSELVAELGILLDDMHKNKQDLVISIFGDEGSGKSILGLNLAKTVDKSFNAKTVPYKVAQTVNDFGRLAPDTKPFESCIWDEAHRLKKRGASSNSVNSDILTYFQDIREGKKIILLLYPRFKEIDSIVIERSRLFFETYRGEDNSFRVKGWKKKQMRLKVRELALPSPKTRAALWHGTPQTPMTIFHCDFKGIEEEFAAYQTLKAQSIKNTDETLREKYGFWNVLKISGEVWSKLQGLKIDRSVRTIREVVANITINLLESGRPIQKEGFEFKVYDEPIKNEIVNLAVEDFVSKQSKYFNVRPPSRHENAGDILTNIDVTGKSIPQNAVVNASQIEFSASDKPDISRA